MALRVRPRDVDVPGDDPFRHDRLARKEPVEHLTALLRSVEGPCVIAVDAPWGQGSKTSFLRMWAAYLRAKGFRVAEFNAWETDFSGDPFPAVATEIIGAFDEKVEAKERVKKAAVRVAKHALPAAVRLGTAGLVNVSAEDFSRELGAALASYAGETIERYQEGKRAVEEFRARLTGLAGEGEKAPLVVLVDELDRCRPSYALELLEAVKHLFSVDGVVFVFGIDRSELAHAVRAVYGGGFNASGYLRRFFDVDYALPSPEREAFVNEAFDAAGIAELLRRTSNPDDGNALFKPGVFMTLSRFSDGGWSGSPETCGGVR